MASSTGGSARFFLKDLHGDTVGAVNASGSVMGSKLYSPWGEPAASAGETYSAGFQSQPTDADTGYVDMTTRLYSPTQGRFSSRDVLFGDTNSPSSMNQYGYAEGSPVSLADASGMAAVSSVGGCTAWANKPVGGGGQTATYSGGIHCDQKKDITLRVGAQYCEEGTNCSNTGGSSKKECEGARDCKVSHTVWCASGVWRTWMVNVVVPGQSPDTVRSKKVKVCG